MEYNGQVESHKTCPALMWISYSQIRVCQLDLGSITTTSLYLKEMRHDDNWLS